MAETSATPRRIVVRGNQRSPEELCETLLGILDDRHLDTKKCVACGTIAIAYDDDSEEDWEECALCEGRLCDECVATATDGLADGGQDRQVVCESCAGPRAPRATDNQIVMVIGAGSITLRESAAPASAPPGVNEPADPIWPIEALIAEQLAAL